MTDADNDDVRCRWAREDEECGDVCGGNPNARISLVSPNSDSVRRPAGRNSGARYKIALLEDEKCPAAKNLSN